MHQGHGAPATTASRLVSSRARLVPPPPDQGRAWTFGRAAGEPPLRKFGFREVSSLLGPAAVRLVWAQCPLDARGAAIGGRFRFGGWPPPSAGGAARDAAVAALETEVRLLRQMLDDMKAERADLKADRDGWKGQAERLALAPPRRAWWLWRRA